MLVTHCTCGQRRRERGNERERRQKPSRRGGSNSCRDKCDKADKKLASKASEKPEAAFVHLWTVCVARFISSGNFAAHSAGAPCSQICGRALMRQCLALLLATLRATLIQHHTESRSTPPTNSVVAQSSNLKMGKTTMVRTWSHCCFLAMFSG